MAEIKSTTTKTFDSRDEWLAFRRRTIGASDSAAALGESPWKSPYALWLEKTGRIEDSELSEAAEWGLALEEPICRAVSRRTGRRVAVRKPMSVDVHPDVPWLTCTLDARQWCDERRGPGTLQVKTANAWTDAWKDEPPLHYQIQLQHEMAVCGFSWGSLVVLIGGQRLLGPFDYTFQPEFWESALKGLCAFWAYVETDEPPPVDDSLSTSSALGRAYKFDDGGTITLTDEWADEIERRAALKKEIDALSKDVRQIENELKAVMESSAEALLPDGRKIVYRTSERKGYEVKPSTVRTLRFPKSLEVKDG